MDPSARADGNAGERSSRSFITGPLVVAALIEKHLDVARLHQIAASRGERTAGNLYDLDRAWCARTAAIDTVLPAFVCTGLLEAARHHLRGIAALLALDNVDIAVGALARACCESSARAAAVLDASVDSKTRVTRALNDALHSLGGASAAAVGPEDGSLLTTARRLAINVHMSKSGRLVQFGDEPRPRMTPLTRKFLTTQASLPAETFDRIWRLWNGAAHGGLDAGLGLGLGGGEKGFAQVRVSAALTALTACAKAQEHALAYQGFPGLATAVPFEEPRSALDPTLTPTKPHPGN